MHVLEEQVAQLKQQIAQMSGGRQVTPPPLLHDDQSKLLSAPYISPGKIKVIDTLLYYACIEMALQIQRNAGQKQRMVFHRERSFWNLSTFSSSISTSSFLSPTEGSSWRLLRMTPFPCHCYGVYWQRLLGMWHSLCYSFYQN